MITKAKVISSLDNLPENVTIDQVIDRLIYIEKIQKGIEDSKNGRVNSKDDAKKKLSKWIK